MRNSPGECGLAQSEDSVLVEGTTAQRISGKACVGQEQKSVSWKKHPHIARYGGLKWEGGIKGAVYAE